MQESSEAANMCLGAGVSGHLDPGAGAEYAAKRCAESLNGLKPDVAFVFFSSHHVESAPAIVQAIRRVLDPGSLIGCSAESVIGGEIEMENAPGVSVLAGVLPGTKVKCFATDEIPLVREGSSPEDEAIAYSCGFGGSHRATFILADPFSVPMNTILPSMVRARNSRQASLPGSHGFDAETPRPGPILGGLASASSKPLGNALILNDRIMRSGGVGLSISGSVRVDWLVSQGCKPVGQPMVVTACKGQMILQLGGRPALDALEDVLNSLNEDMRQKLRRGLFIGRAVSEYKPRFGRDDFLIRNVVGVEKTGRAIAVADLFRVGQTIQFHIRDATTASEDLALLLDLQRLYEPPEGVLLFTCNGRGSRLFEKPHHDAGAISRAFSATPGEQAAKMGSPIPVLPPRARPVPLAGFFAAGEIGPVGNDVFVHGQTACAALFRKP